MWKPKTWTLVLPPGETSLPVFTLDLQYVKRIDFAVKTDKSVTLVFKGSDELNGDNRGVCSLNTDNSASVAFSAHILPRLLSPEIHKPKEATVTIVIFAIINVLESEGAFGLDELIRV